MKNKEIFEQGDEISSKFEKEIEGIEYQLRGVLNSEALLLAAITEAMDVELIIESGRARGYSTKILAEFFNDNPKLEIASIDFDKYSKDAKYSEKEMAEYNNVSLLYGDAHQLAPALATKDCIVFIDGPKGDEALLLSIELLKNKNVKAVCVHDLHQSTFHRDICSMIFNNTFFSDNQDFVEKFSYLDKPCWEKLDSDKEQPYLRKGQEINSYGSTLGVIFNKDNTLTQPQVRNFEEYRKRESSPPTSREFISGQIPNSLKRKIRDLRDILLR